MTFWLIGIHHHTKWNEKCGTYTPLLQVHLAGELLAHLVQCPLGPVTKPVQHTPVEQGRGCSRTVLQALWWGIHGEHHMQVLDDLHSHSKYEGKQMVTKVKSNWSTTIHNTADYTLFIFILGLFKCINSNNKQDQDSNSTTQPPDL